MGFFHPIRDARRKKLAGTRLQAERAEMLDTCVPYCTLLAAEERLRLEGLIQIFLAEKRFEGCRGMTITESIQVTIAAEACLLLLNLRHDFYARLATILVYPADFFFERESPPRDGISFIETQDVAGLSTNRGAVALSWTNAAGGVRNPGDGMNVILHEFAHQLDVRHASRLLAGRAALRAWARTLAAEFDRFRENVARGWPTFINAYGATNPEEFFAVVTEHFFESPAGLSENHPDLYAAFRLYYGQDPVTRFLHEGHLYGCSRQRVAPLNDQRRG